MIGTALPYRMPFSRQMRLFEGQIHYIIFCSSLSSNLRVPKVGFTDKFDWAPQKKQVPRLISKFESTAICFDNENIIEPLAIASKLAKESWQWPSMEPHPCWTPRLQAQLNTHASSSLSRICCTVLNGPRFGGRNESKTNDQRKDRAQKMKQNLTWKMSLLAERPYWSEFTFAIYACIRTPNSHAFLHNLLS